jgi:hypothetical protein
VRLSEDTELPQAANFVGWSELLMNILCPEGAFVSYANTSRLSLRKLGN